MAKTLDIFLSHSGKDKVAVRQIAEALRDRGLEVWLDEWELIPGRPWMETLQEASSLSRSSVVFVGRDKRGPWEIPELRACLSQMADRGLPIVPVLLPGAPERPEFPPFLAHHAWVNLRSGITSEGIENLIGSIYREKKPGLRWETASSGFHLHNLPMLPLGDLLKGRNKELQELAESLTDPSQSTFICQSHALHGLGGIGKTRLAVEYAWRSASQYSAAFFVHAETPAALRAGLAGLASPSLLNLPERDAQAETKVINAVLRWLREHPNWLLILDSVDTKETAQAVRDMLPTLGKGHVLITSRLKESPLGIKGQQLGILPVNEATEFLLQRTKMARSRENDDLVQAQRLTENLGGHPLALEQAADYINRTKTTIAAYLESWERERNVLHWHDKTSVSYPASVAVTWQKAFQELGPTARAILRLTAYLAPDLVPIEMFDAESLVIEKAVELLCEETGEKPEKQSVKASLAELAAYSMVTRQGSAFIVHRIVQELLRGRIPEEHQHDWIEKSLQLVDSFAPSEPGDVRTWPVWDILRPHAAEIVHHGDSAGIFEPTFHLMSKLGQLLESKGLYADAEPFMQRALEIAENFLGSEHPMVAIALNNLAHLLQATNRLSEAEGLMRKALQIAEEAFGSQHPNVAVALNNLAQLLHETNRLAEAEPLMRRALVIGEEAFGPQHPNVAIALSNLAQLLTLTNRASEAEPLMRHALRIDEDSFGSQHPEVATRLNNLAQLLQATNRLAEAEPLIRRALEIDEYSLGPQHPRVAIDLSNLAQLLLSSNRLSEAESLMRRALQIDEGSFGAYHPRIAIRLNNLAHLLKASNRLSEAEPLMRRAVEAFERELGPDHPRTRRALSNLEVLLKEIDGAME